MNNPYSSPNEKELLHQLKEQNQSAFSALYDRYAPSLLGVITTIIHHDQLEANELLEKTFTKVHAQIAQYKPEEQPLFIWLLKIGRQTAVDALAERKSQHQSTFQLTASDQVIASTPQTNTPVPIEPTPAPVDSQLKELLDSVLFKNCTPEEAATTIGLPVESARQQLRRAMQQIRAGQ